MASGFSNVLEDAALGGLVGGAAGGLIEGSAAAIRAAKSGAGKLAGKVGRAAESMAVPTQYKIDFEAATKSPQAVAESLGPMTSQDIGQLADGIKGGQPSSLLAAARGAADEFGDTQQGAVRAISKDLEEFYTDVQDVRDVAGRTAKTDWVRSLPLEGLDLTPAFAQIDNVERVLKERLDNTNAVFFGSSGATLKQAQEAADATRNALMDVYAGKKSTADALVALDDFKSFLQRGTNVKNPMAQQTLENLSEGMRLHLEDSNVYGAFADGQRKLNRSIYEGIAAEYDDSIRAWSKQGSEQSEFDPFLVHKRPNEQHIGGFLNSIAKSEVRGDEAAFRKFLRLKAIDAQTRADLYQSPLLAEKAQKIASAAGRIEDSINAVALKAKDRTAWEKFAGSAATVRNVAAMSSVATGPAGLAVAGAAQLVGSRWFASAVGTAAKKAAALEHSLAAASDMAVHNITMQGKAARGAVVSAASAGAINRAIKQARDLEDNDSSASAQLRMLKEELQADDPAFADHAVNAVKARAKFLSEKAGPAMDSSDPLGPRPPLQNRVQQAALQRYADAAVVPANALRRLGAGIGTAEDIETLRTLYPALYADFVQRVQAKIQNVNPTVKQRQNLQRITGVPATRVSAAWLQQVAHAPEEQPMPAGPAPGGGAFDPDRVAVASDRIMNGE